MYNEYSFTTAGCWVLGMVGMEGPALSPLVYTPPLAAQMGTLVQSLQEARTESTSHQHTVNSDSGAHAIT